MAIQVLDGFDYRGANPNFVRDKFADLAAMRAFPESGIDNGHICYVESTGLYYQFNSSNGIDISTGKWKLYNNPVDTIDIEEETREGYIASETALRTEILRAQEVESELSEGKVNLDDIVDDLNTPDATKPLSANMGNNLNVNKINYEDIYKEDISGAEGITDRPLSADLGYALNDRIDTFVSGAITAGNLIVDVDAANHTLEFNFSVGNTDTTFLAVNGTTLNIQSIVTQ